MRRFAILLMLAAIDLLAGCQALGPPSVPPTAIDPAALQGFPWPPLAADPALTADARRVCLPDLGVAADIPMVLQDRRERDRATVVFADDKTVAFCTVLRTSEGTLPEGGSATQDRWTRDVGLVVTPGGLNIEDATISTEGSEWSILKGLLPPGATAIHAVIRGQRVDGVVGDGLYSLTWRGGLVPSALVAFDREGREIARIDGPSLTAFWDRACPPASLRCTPEP